MSAYYINNSNTPYDTENNAISEDVLKEKKLKISLVGGFYK